MITNQLLLSNRANLLFIDKDKKRILNGDLWYIEDNKLQKMLSQGPKSCEKKRFNMTSLERVFLRSREMHNIMV